VWSKTLYLLRKIKFKILNISRKDPLVLPIKRKNRSNLLPFPRSSAWAVGHARPV